MAQLITTTVRGDLTINGESASADLHVDRTTGRVGINRLVDDARDYALDVNGDLYADNLYGDGSNITNLNLGDYTTDDVAEGSQNLYFEDGRVHAALSAAGMLEYNDAGQFSFTLTNTGGGLTLSDDGAGTVDLALDLDAVSGQLDDNYVNATGGDSMAGTLTITGANADDLLVVEGDITFTEADGTVRSLQTLASDFDALDVSADIGGILQDGQGVQINASGGAGDYTQTYVISLDFTEFTSADVVEGSTNLFYTDARVHAALGTGDIGDLTYDGAGNFRFALADHDTDDLGEGSTNLYFTDTRAVDAIEGAGALTLTGGLTLAGDLDMGGNDINNVGNIDIGTGTLSAARIQSGDTYVDVSGGVVEFGDGGAAVGTVSDTEVSFTHNALEIDSDNGTDHITLRSDLTGDNTATLYVRNGLDNNDADLVVRNLTVTGTTTIVNSEQVAIADNILVLNSDVTGDPTEDGGIEVQRGTEDNASLIWDEVDEVWKAGTAGGEIEIALVGDNLSQFTNDLALSSFANDFTTDNIDEGSANLYYEDGRVHAAISVTGDLTYDGAGTIGFALTDHDTSDLAENPGVAATGRDIAAGQNAYFTAARAVDAVEAAGALALEGDLSVAGTSTFTGLATFDGSATVNGDITVTGNVDGVDVSDLYDQVQTLSGGVGALTTDDIAEGTGNLFFTEARVHDSLGVTGDLTYDGSGTFGFALADHTTEDLPEGSGALFFTAARVHDALAVGGQLAYDNAGTFSFSVVAGDGVGITDNGDGTVTIDATLGSSVDTDDVEEGSTNLYFTDERVDDRVSALVQDGTGITWTYDDGAGTLTPALDLDQLSDQLDDNYVNVTGDTMTGDLTVDGDVFFNSEEGPTVSLAAFHADFVNATGGGSGSLADQFVNVDGDDMTGALRIGADFTGHSDELLFVDGDATVTGTLTAGAIVETSTIRMKEQVVNMGSQLDRIMQLNPVEFTWKTNKKRDLGLIAEQVQKIYPELVGKDGRGATGVHYSKLTSVLIQSVKELNAKVEELQAKLRQK